MPLYVRAGTIIPMIPVMQYTDERPINQLTLCIWRGTDEWTLYEDDGHTFEYKNGAWATTAYSVSIDGQRTIFEIAARQGNWTLPLREVIVQLVGVGEQRFQDNGTASRLSFY